MNVRLAAAAVAVTLLAGCGPLKYSLQSTPAAPGADAVLTAEIHPAQGRTQVNLTVSHLAPPDRVQPGATAFIAWYRKDNAGTWGRIGAIVYDLSSRDGKMEGASVPETTFDLQVTAEKVLDPASPSTVVVFSQHVQPK